MTTEYRVTTEYQLLQHRAITLDGWYRRPHLEMLGNVRANKIKHKMNRFKHYVCTKTKRVPWKYIYTGTDIHTKYALSLQAVSKYVTGIQY